ncbi:MAG: flagellar biosynthesis protein FlhF [Hydrogenophilales bacterium]|nr:flagellar biosynthesis protein FlhF [Hydrogenophilales bacterium]
MIKKFHATTTRDALRQVRDELGANAIILSNRQSASGVEIIAVADLDMAAIAQQAEPAGNFPNQARRPPHVEARANPAVAGITTFTDYLAQKEGSVIRSAREHAPAPLAAPAKPAEERRTQQVRNIPETEPATHNAAADTELQPVMHELACEVRMLRALVEGQLAGLAWGDVSRRDPHRAEIMKRLLASGFSPALTRQFLDRLPADESLEKAFKWVRAAIAHNLKVTPQGADLVDRGGVYALVGPTGVGKTTTIAKLAARAVLKHGANNVAMITTDSYRIGAQDQLRIYGRILGAPVFAVRDENDLALTLLDHADKHLILIDTMGMSQRDKRVAEQINMLCGEELAVKRILLMGAPAQGITLEEVMRAFTGPGLDGCILTKIDEALSYGPVLDVAIRHQLPIHYVTNGQRVPEDLHMANALYLVDRAFRLGMPDSPFMVEDEDYPVLMAAAESNAPDIVAPRKGGLNAA